MRIRLIKLVGRQFCPTVMACAERHADNRSPISPRITFAQLILSKNVMYTVYSPFSVPLSHCKSWVIHVKGLLNYFCNFCNS